MGMRDYVNLKDLVIPKEREKIMDIFCAAWDGCRNMGHCKDCPDRQMLKEKFSLLECFSLKYSRMLIEAGYAPVVHGRDTACCPSLFECSACGWRDIDTLTGDTSTHNYCPNCGAKMDLEPEVELMGTKDEYKDYGVVKINNKGKYKLNLAYTEITRLHVMLEENQIPHFFHRIYDGWQVIYPNVENQKISAVQHYFSYGSRENRIEITGGITPADGTSDSVLGHLTAENVFGRIITMHKAKFSDNSDRCVCCGDVIPEGRQVCPTCEEGET